MTRTRNIKGCVLHLRGDNADNTGTGAADLSDYRQAESTYNGSMGVVGGEFVFDGVDDYLKHTGQLPGIVAGEWSYSLWFTPQVLGQHVVSFADETVTSRYCSLLINANKLQVNLVGPVEGTVTLNGGTVLVAGTQYHVVVNLTASGLEIWLNGVAETLTVASGTNENKTYTDGQIDNLVLGGLVRTTAGAFSEVDIVSFQFASRALSAGEIKNLASSTDFVPFGNYSESGMSIQPSRYSGGGDLLDEAGNGNDLTPTATVAVVDGIMRFSGEGVDTSVSLASSPGTISCWVKSTDTMAILFSEAGVVVGCANEGDAINGHFTPDITSPVTYIDGVGVSGAYSRDDLFNVLCDGAWHHFAFTGDFGSAWSSIDIGKYSGAWYYTGDMDDLRIDSRIYSAQEVKYLYNNGTPGVETPNTYGSVGYWSPSYDDAGNGSLELLDYSGDANVGTLTDMAVDDWVADTDSGGVRKLTLDGTNDRVALPAFAFGEEFTVSLFAYIDSAGTQVLFSKRESVTVESVQAFVTASAIAFRVYSADDVWTGRSGPAVATGEWLHICFRYGVSAGPEIFVNGSKVDTTDDNSGAFTTFNDLDIASEIGSQNGGLSFLGGAVDDVIVTPRAITSAEITELAATRNPFAPAVETPATTTNRRPQASGIPGL